MKVIILISSGLLYLSTPVYAIQKCQDAAGNWHYGDAAQSQCVDSEVTTLNDRGFVMDTEEAPRTDAELAEDAALGKAKLERAALAEAEQEERRRILSIYETEKDIDRQRDNQLNSVQSSIDVHTAHQRNLNTHIASYTEQLKNTNSEASKQALHEKLVAANEKIVASEEELSELEAQKQRIERKFAKERELYLTYKKPSTSNSAKARY